MSHPVRISIGGYQRPGSVHTRGLYAFRDALTRIAGDAVDVVVHANLAAEGHKTADLPAMVERGEIDACYISSSYLAERVPALSLFDMPFAAPTRDRAFALLDGPLGERFEQEIASQTDLALMGVWDNGMRHMSTSGKALRYPGDCAGLVLRTLPNTDHQRVFRALGFIPKVIDAADLAGAVANGDVDAQENPLTNAYNFGLHSALPTFTLTGHLMGIALVLFNRERLMAWPSGLRCAVKAALAEASQFQRAIARDEEDACAKPLLRDGAEIINLTSTERDAWCAAAAPEVASIRARLAPDLLDLFGSDAPVDQKVPVC